MDYARVRLLRSVAWTAYAYAEAARLDHAEVATAGSVDRVGPTAKRSESQRASRRRLVEMALPVARHLAGRTRRWLIERMVLGWR